MRPSIAYLRVTRFSVQETFGGQPTVALFEVEWGWQSGLPAEALFDETFFDDDWVAEYGSLVITSGNYIRDRMDCKLLWPKRFFIGENAKRKPGKKMFYIF